MVIQHNMAAMNADRQYNIVTGRKKKHIEKLSSGYRINRAADDAAGLAISEKMRRQIRGLTQASANCQDGVSFCQVADGALHEVHDMLQRINELAIQSANGTNSAEDRSYLDEEVQNIKKELSRVFRTTEFNGHKIWVEPYVPEVARNDDSLDFILYNDTNNGRIGGVEVENVRYTWNELGILGDISADGETFVCSGRVDKRLPSGEMLMLSYKEGQRLTEISRMYTWGADADGITINGNSAEKVSWASMGLDPANVKEGTYRFDYHGFTVSFDVPEGDDFLDVMTAVNGDGLNDVTWQTVYAGSFPKSAVTLSGYSGLTFTAANQKYLMDTGWEILADDNGVKLSGDKYAADYTRKNWNQFSDIASGNYPIVDWGLTADVTDDVTLDDSAHYQYKDNVSGFSFQFQLEDEISKESAIQSLNHTKVDKFFHASADNTVYTASTTDPSISPAAAIEVKIKTEALSFGMQNVLGRNMYEAVSYSTRSGFSSWDSSTETGTFAFSVRGNNTSYSTAQTANYTCEISKASLENALLTGGTKSFTLTLQNGDALLAGATAAECEGGIKGVTPELTMEIDFTNLSNAYKNEKDARTAAYHTAVSAPGLSQAAKDALTAQYQTDCDAIFGKYYDEAQKMMGLGSAAKSTNFSAEKAGVAVHYGVYHSDAYSTEFGMVVNAPGKQLEIQAGTESDAEQRITLRWDPLNLSVLALGGVNVRSESASLSAVALVKYAMRVVSGQRSDFGAYQNRMEHTINNLNNVVENTTAAESAIRDTDMAKEAVQNAIANILAQAGESILAQANRDSQGVLTLLGG